MGDFWGYSELIENYYEPEEPLDATVEEAKTELKAYFTEHPKAVFYMRQLAVKHEKRFFHWVTSRAVGELIEEDFLREHREILEGAVKVRFVFSKRHRYIKTQVKEMMKVVREYSDHDLAFGCGRQAEVLFLKGLMGRGFTCLGEEINKFNGKKWTKTDHDLDYIVEKDGIVYGCEVKNTLDYIDKEELSIKLDICGFLGIKPLFIMRFAPKTYNYEIIERGGFALLFEAQIYPFGQQQLVQRITKVLGLPVVCPRDIPEGIINRFLKWHTKNL